MKESIKVFAPATVANVTCGFDILGFAVAQPGDELVLTKSDLPKVRITKVTGDQGKLPTETNKNTASVAVQKYLDHIGSDQGLEITLHKKMPLGSGLGSSAASSVAGVFAANQLLGQPLSNKDLLPFAMEGERVACGAAHADNVAPALLGGFALVRSYEPLDVVKIPTPLELYATLIYPQINIATRDARDILKKQILLGEAVKQWGNVAGLMAGLMQSDYDLISRSMEDVIIEPTRSILIPGFDQVKNNALEAGALGAGISGSGPSLFALSRSREVAIAVGDQMTRGFDSFEIESELFISEINQSGPLILD